MNGEQNRVGLPVEDLGVAVGTAADAPVTTELQVAVVGVAITPHQHTGGHQPSKLLCSPNMQPAIRKGARFTPRLACSRSAAWTGGEVQV